MQTPPDQILEDQWGRVRYHWRSYNHAYGTWFELVCERKGMAAPIKMASTKEANVEVQPDMEPGRWYWSVKVGLTKKTAEKPRWGSAPTAEEAMQLAWNALMDWSE